jgi:hypothetical protein
MTDKVLLFSRDKLKEQYPEKFKILIELWPVLVDRLQLNPEPELTFYKRVKDEFYYNLNSKKFGYEIENEKRKFDDLAEMKQGQTGLYIESLDGESGIYIDAGRDLSHFIKSIAHELWHRYQRQEKKDFLSEPDAEEFAREVYLKFNRSQIHKINFKSMSLAVEEIKESWWQ